jgi:hypothetical protein
MSFTPIYGLQRTRIILYADDGTTPLYRVTLQKETREGLELAFKPEGTLHQLGSGAGWARRWIHRGWRMTLSIKWDVGLESTAETWDPGTSTWITPTVIPTAQALSSINTWATHAPCRVSPHQDLNLDFLAQPDPGGAFKLRDLKGVAHTNLDLVLIATNLLGDTPDWANLNNYFAPGYIADDYIGWTP